MFYGQNAVRHLPNIYRRLDQRDRHYQIHISNPQINFIRSENCVYCKRERTNRYSNHIDQRNLSDLDRFQDIGRYHDSNNSTRPQLTREQTIRLEAVRNLLRERGRHYYQSGNLNDTIYTVNIDNLNSLNNTINYDDLEPVPVPLNLEQLNRASSIYVYNLSEQEHEQEQEKEEEGDEEEENLCTICQESFQYGDIIRLFKEPCLHQFHLKCIDKWLEKKHKCPNCRYDLRKLKSQN